MSTLIALLLLVLTVSNGFGQLGPDGTGTVNGYEIGIGVTLGGVNFSNADLSGAMLWKARMQKVNLHSYVQLYLYCFQLYLCLQGCHLLPAKAMVLQSGMGVRPQFRSGCIANAFGSVSQCHPYSPDHARRQHATKWAKLL